MKFIKPRILLLLAVICVPIRIAAEDIDLFVGPSTATSDSPNVLIILDNTANWGPEDKFQAQKQALVTAFNQLPDDQINIGLMMYTESGGGNKGPDGGYVRAAVRNMNEYTKAVYSRMLVGPDPNDPVGGLGRLEDASNSGKSGKTMAEAYLYFNSNYQGSVQSYEQPYSGNNKEKVDWGTGYGGPSTGNVTKNAFLNKTNNPTCCEDSHGVWQLPENTDIARNVGPNALNRVDSTEYNSPVDPNECADNYIIFIGNGPAQDSANDSKQARDLLAQQRGSPDTTTIDDLDPPNSVDNMADEWARYMYRDSPLSIATFAIDVQIGPEGVLDNPSPLGWSALMRSMSEGVGGGEYYDVKGETFDPNDFALALEDAFSRILARNSVFASVALPAAANEQSTFLNQVYVGLFRPDAGADPRWYGNLKQYQLGIDPDDGRLKALDAQDPPQELIDRTQGFIQGCAVSFWTPGSEAGDYWDFLGDKAVANCSEATRYKNTPDGPIVEKGGQAYTLRTMTPSSRKVYTCSATMATCSSTTALVDFTNLTGNGVTKEMLDPNDPTSMSDSERDNLLKWAIGYDVDNEIKATTPDPTAMRPSVHGDIVHSQPVAVDYNADPTDPQVVVFYGGNDGMLRAINGNQTTNHGTGTPDAGYEFWSFIPPEFYGSIKRLRVNSPRVIFPASGPTAGEGVAGTAKSYGMDGPLTAHQADLNGDDVIDETNDERLLFAGMRRAGRAIYAFDITDRDSPKMKWKVGCPNLDDDSGCTPSTGNVWEDIGQTWSRVNVTYAAGYTDAGEMAPIILVGGGYDNCEDTDTGTGVTPVQNNSCSSGTKGNRAYVLDARTGAVLKSFPTDRSVPGNITVVPISDDVQQIMFAYLADTGGNIYRISGAKDTTTGNYSAIGGSLPGTWEMTKIASLGCSTTASCDQNRKFLFGPDVIRIPGSNLLGILLGSGDREKPLQDYSATLDLQNYFFSMVDDPTNGAWLTSENSTSGGPCGADVICMASLGEITLPGVLPEDDIEGGTPTAKGWRLEMRAGEQIVTGAITIDNEVNFSTHIPAVPGECGSDYGTATAFSLNYLDASGDATQFLGGGLVPTPVAGKVLIDGVPVPFCIGCGGEDSAIGVKKVGGGITWTQPRSRVYWNIDRVD